jgi:hypothetical protein
MRPAYLTPLVLARPWIPSGPLTSRATELRGHVAQLVERGRTLSHVTGDVVSRAGIELPTYWRTLREVAQKLLEDVGAAHTQLKITRQKLRKIGGTLTSSDAATQRELLAVLDAAERALRPQIERALADLALADARMTEARSARRLGGAAPMLAPATVEMPRKNARKKRGPYGPREKASFSSSAVMVPFAMTAAMRDAATLVADALGDDVNFAVVVRAAVASTPPRSVDDLVALRKRQRVAEDEAPLIGGGVRMSPALAQQVADDAARGADVGISQSALVRDSVERFLQLSPVSRAEVVATYTAEVEKARRGERA